MCVHESVCECVCVWICGWAEMCVCVSMCGCVCVYARARLCACACLCVHTCSTPTMREQPRALSKQGAAVDGPAADAEQQHLPAWFAIARCCSNEALDPTRRL